MPPSPVPCTPPDILATTYYVKKLIELYLNAGSCFNCFLMKRTIYLRAKLNYYNRIA